MVANLSVLLTFVLAAVLSVYNEPLYYQSVQEDQVLEWATFWGFLVAGYVFSVNSVDRFRLDQRIPWFMAALALFCFAVAMEEISWGQRLLGYKAPTFFLEQNYQQEFNIHNVVETMPRKRIMQAVLLGWGVILSIGSLWQPVAREFRRFRIVVPPAILAVSFFAILFVFTWYPLYHTGEWVELTMAYVFMFVALSSRVSATGKQSEPGIGNVLIALAGIWILAAATYTAICYLQYDDPRGVQTARNELAALGRDFSSGQLETSCGVHARLYTFVREHEQSYLLRGDFSGLVQGKRENARAAYLLDPWNSSYWIRHQCAGSREIRFVYSFGPNRRRESTVWQIGGDDIGYFIDLDP